MDFMVGLSKTLGTYDSIWVDYNPKQLAKIYIKEIMRLQGMPLNIIFDIYTKCTSNFWDRLHKELGSKITFRTTFYPQIDRQSERTIQVLEDMLSSYVTDFRGHWDQFLPLCEFSYNNYHSSIDMAPFEELYERRCRSPIRWSNTRDFKPLGTDLVKRAQEKVRFI